MIPIIIARPGRAEPPRRWSCSSSLANMLAAADAETQGRRSIGQMGADRGARRLGSRRGEWPAAPGTGRRPIETIPMMSEVLI